MAWKETYALWLAYLAEHDASGFAEAQSLPESDRESIFSGELSFGTGGLRSTLGIGPACMNQYTVARATQGLANVIQAHSEIPASVGIGYDTRHGSRKLALITAGVLIASGIPVYLFDRPAPTPLLSFAVRHLELGWGVVLTASHNPKQYNGYKVYDHRGVQLLPEQAEEVLAAGQKVPMFSTPLLPEDEIMRSALHHRLGEALIDTYVALLPSAIPNSTLAQSHGHKLPLVYSALYGSGAAAVPKALAALGFSTVTAVQQTADGNFGGLKTPNPEEPVVYTEARAAAQKQQAALLLATDPDCDRVGVMVWHEGNYVPLNGNQIGALLLADLLENKPNDRSVRVLVTTLVSGTLAQRIAEANGVAVRTTYTGFKYIGDVAENLPAEGKRFLFGYEESYGYLAGDLARDKDAVWAVGAICCLALHAQLKGENLYQRWLALSSQYGFFVEALFTQECAGLDGVARIAGYMQRLRKAPPSHLAGIAVVRWEDYSQGFALNCQTNRREPLLLPPSDMIKLYLADKSWIALRPSGTEPKIKCYTATCGSTLAEAEQRRDVLKTDITSIFQ